MKIRNEMALLLSPTIRVSDALEWEAILVSLRQSVFLVPRATMEFVTPLTWRHAPRTRSRSCEQGPDSGPAGGAAPVSHGGPALASKVPGKREEAMVRVAPAPEGDAGPDDSS